jgi:hypothetical protein
MRSSMAAVNCCISGRPRFEAPSVLVYRHILDMWVGGIHRVASIINGVIGHDILTVAVPETARFEASALEEFLITELQPQENHVGVDK